MRVYSEFELRDMKNKIADLKWYQFYKRFKLKREYKDVCEIYGCED